jgi:PhnB protein
MEDSMKLDVYVNYKRKCREAFRYYEQHLGGKIISMRTFGQMTDGANVPDERKNDIVHGRIELFDAA